MKAIFLDRDGIINIERGEYTFKIDDFEVIPNIIETLTILKNKNFLLIVATNQSGISRGFYGKNDMQQCHYHFQHLSNHLIDAFYYAPLHPTISNSLSRKPDSLMFERAIARFKLDPNKSWMVGDKERDIIPALKLGINSIILGKSKLADFQIKEVSELPGIILGQ